MFIPILSVVMGTTLRGVLATSLTTAAVLALTACGPDMSWEQKLDALRAAGERGADAHYVLLTQNQQPTKQTCTDNYRVFMGDRDSPPSEWGDGDSSSEWRDLHLSYFVDSCISGQPRRPVTRPVTPPPPPAPPPAAGQSPAPPGQ